MNFRRSLWALLAAAAVMTALDFNATPAQAQTRVVVVPNGGFYYSPGGPFLYTPGMQYSNWGSYPGMMYSPYYYSSYVAPYPAYNILPPPFMTYNASSSEPNNPYGSQKTAEDYGYTLEQQPRKRKSLSPAIPFQPEAEKTDPLAEAKRAKIEVTVPNADARVYMDGAPTRQGGINRVYYTPPLEDKSYKMTVKVEWTDQAGMHTKEKTFDLIQGEHIQFNPLTK